MTENICDVCGQQFTRSNPMSFVGVAGKCCSKEKCRIEMKTRFERDSAWWVEGFRQLRSKN